MAEIDTLVKHVRLELGDALESFRDSFRGTGEQSVYDLPARNVKEVLIFTVGEDGVTHLTPGTDFLIDFVKGEVRFPVPPEKDLQHVVEGTAFGIFNDEEIEHFIEMAGAQHLNNRTVQTRYRDGHGFIKYDRVQMELEDLPHNEEILVTLLASIEALWALSTDASTDIDVTTSEGTHIPRGQRWRQITAQIDILTDKYESLSLAMGVGLHAPEVMNLRRVSRSTGRLVPVFQEREYDEHGPPIRKLPARGNRDEDPDGPASPYWSGTGGF